MAKGNLIIPRQNSITGCSLTSYPGQIIIIIIIILGNVSTHRHKDINWPGRIERHNQQQADKGPLLS